MRKEYFFVMLLLFTHKNIAAQLEKLNDGIILKNVKGDAHTLQVRVLCDNIVRISASPSSEFSNRNNVIENKICEKPQISLVVGSERITIKTSTLIICVDPADGRVLFLDKQNNSLLQECKRIYKPYKNFVENFWSVQQEFKWSIGEELFGFSKNFDQKQSIRGGKFDIFCNSANNSPLILSSKGYGVVWDNNSISYFNNTANNSYLYSEQADQIDYYFIYGPTSNDIVVNYCKLIGSKNSETDFAFLKGSMLKQEEKPLGLVINQ